MEIVIAGGHGKIALLTAAALAPAGHRVRALVRNPDHAQDVRDVGAEPVTADLETLDAPALGDLVGTADAIVFAAGAGPDSGPERKRTVDFGAARTLVEVARARGIDRYVMVSAVGADPEAEDDGGFGTYLRAKGMADRELAASGLRYTILRPVHLTDTPGTGEVSTDPDAGSDEIARADVAAAIVVALVQDTAVGATLVLRSGATPVAQALAHG